MKNHSVSIYLIWNAAYDIVSMILLYSYCWIFIYVQSWFM